MSMPSDSITVKASAYWDSVKPEALPRRYWLFDACIRSINRRLGVDSVVWTAGLMERLRVSLNGTVLKRGISIGCGAGGKELKLIREGFIHGFDLYEISQARIAQGIELFRTAGLADRVNFSAADGLSALRQSEAYDLVYWDSALHHMPDVFEALELSVNAVRKGGFIIVNEYVGPNRFQWTDEQIRFANLLRAALPERFFSKSAGARFPVSRTVTKPTIEAMIALDPTEAPDSEAILPAIEQMLPGAQVWLLGGVIYHLALNDVLANFRLPEDLPLLDLAMLSDEALSFAGYNHFAAAIFRKP